MTRTARRRLAWIAPLLALIVVAGAYWFQPWKLVTDREVDEALTPVSAPSTPAAASPSGTPESTVPAGPVVVRQGEFVSHEHDTDGAARVVRDPDGSHSLELIGLATSNGPDLRVWLSDQPVRKGRDGWGVFDDGKWVELGRLKGNKGDQRYAIPAGTDLDRLDSVAIWCKRFSVSFGAAALAQAAGHG